MPLENRICSNCIRERFLNSEIARSPVVDVACSYCDETRPTIEMWDLAQRCDKVIEDFYSISSLTDAVTIYDYTPEGEELVDLLENLLVTSGQAAQDLTELLNDMWFDRGSCEHRYGDDNPWFIRTDASPQPLSEAWERMERSLRSEARFVNPLATQTMENIFGPILADRTNDGKSVIVEVGPTAPLDTLYRARVFQTIGALEAALAHPERHLGPPPPRVGQAGRMNAKGVSVFYGSTQPAIAISEVRPPVGSHVVVAAFKISRPLRLLDVTKLASVKLDPTLSVFDPATIEQSVRCRFLNQLESKLTMPVMPELVDEGYLTTQAIADYLATHPRLELDGILFRSVQSAGEPTPSDVHNVILFNKASKVLLSETKYADGVQVRLFDHDEDGIRFEPQLWVEDHPADESEHSPWSNATDESLPALTLDRNTLEIHEIEGVKFTTYAHTVELHVSAQRPASNF
ncbi:RES family NAD+ phosphorylase [Caballeronia sp. 15715]|uniref:RES family NAD+ phosphorylase n=1 Tax=Caballeronia sp. 15715 TaxID=3391030 RepID=UPI0039E3683A